MAVINTHCLDLELDSSQSLSRTDEALLSITGNLTIECWVQFETLPTGQSVFVAKMLSAIGGRSYKFYAALDTGTQYLRLQISADGTALTTSQVSWTPSTGVWYHVAVVYTAAAGTVDFYVNGVQQGAQQTGANTSIFDSSTSSFYIGAEQDSGGAAISFMDGKIDDIRLWSTTRTSTQILDNIRVEIDSATNLVGSWHLNNALTDSSGNSLTLTNNGTATFSNQVPWFEISDTIGVSVESIVFEHTLSITETAGIPTENLTNKYGWGNLAKSSASWTPQTKS